MLTTLARLAIDRPRRLLIGALIAFLVTAVIGAPAAGLLKARNAFADKTSESALAEKSIEQATGKEAKPGILAIVDAPPGSAAVSSAARTLARVKNVATVAQPSGKRRNQPFVSSDGKRSLVVGTLKYGPDPDDVAKDVQHAFRQRKDVTLGGGDVANVQVGEQALSDLGFAELLAFPLLALIAFLVFRGIAALLPLAVGMLSVMGAFFVLRLVNTELSLSIFALNLVIALGLGLAVDYSLFLVWRFREELGKGASTDDAIRTVLMNTGRTVVFSALTVSAALACLVVFPQRFLVSMGVGGAAVALIAAVYALIVVPPLLKLLGPRLGKAKLPDQQGGWYRLAHAIMRRPALVAIATTAVLLLVAAPARNVHWTGVDATVLPTSKSARVVTDTIAKDFPRANGGNTIAVLVKAQPVARRSIQAYARQLGRVDGITRVAPPVNLSDEAWLITLQSGAQPISKAGQATIKAVRSVDSQFPVRVGGQAADFADQRKAVSDNLPLALILLVIVTVSVLWLMTGSVILPFKTLLMNALSAVAATGVLVFVFQDGRLEGLLAYTSQGGIEQTDFLILAAVAFALSTDYGVFLLERIREARSEHDEREAIAHGLQQTGRLVTAASILLAVALGAFATSKVIFLKQVGVGTALAVLIDAFVVRALLVPSLMALLGARNWWAPKPLRSLHRRLVSFAP